MYYGGRPDLLDGIDWFLNAMHLHGSGVYLTLTSVTVDSQEAGNFLDFVLCLFISLGIITRGEADGNHQEGEEGAQD